MMKQFLADYSYNLPLLDALNDPGLPTIRRILAGSAMDTSLDDGYYSTVELYDAFKVLTADLGASVDPDDSLGTAMVEHLLGGEGDDYQRRLYYLISEIPVAEAMGHLYWLTTLLGPRASMWKVLVGAGIAPPPSPGRRCGSAWNAETQTWDVEQAMGVRPFGYD